MLVVCRDPQDPHAGLPLYGGFKFWWDLYDLVKEWRALAGHPGGTAGYLRDEMLKFFEEIHFDPPKRIGRGDEHGARRILREAMAKAMSESPRFKNPRMSSSLWFKCGEDTYVVSLRDDLSVYVVGQGARKVGPGDPILDDAFWETKSAAEQIAWLAQVIHRVEQLEPGDGNSLTIEKALGAFKDGDREIAWTLREEIAKRWPKARPSMGKNTSGVKEISFPLERGSVRLGPYRPNRLIIAFGSDAAPVLVGGIERVLERKLPSPQPSQQVNVPLNMIPAEKIPEILNVIEERASNSRVGRPIEPSRQDVRTQRSFERRAMRRGGC